MRIKELEITSSASVIRGKLWGKKGGHRTLALHGWLDNAASFDGLASQLSGLHLFAPDLPGHGLSAHRGPGNNYHFVDWLGDVMAIAEGLRWGKFSLLGHSLGANIASVLAGVFPERVEKLVLLDGLGPLTSPPKEIGERIRSSIFGRQNLSAEKRFYRTIGEAARARKKSGQLRLESAETLARRALAIGKKGFYWRHDPQLILPSPLRMTEDHVSVLLKKIRCPTLLILADQEYRDLKRICAARAGLIRNLRVLHVKGSHHFHMDRPEAIAGKIADFLKS